MLETARQTITKYHMLSPKDRVLVALSGGADSTALLFVMNDLRPELDLRLYALYINHNLRPLDIDYEIDHCKRLCEGLGIEFFTEEIDVKGYSQSQRINLQESARELRYQCLYKKSEELSISKIALGHTADDQLETILMRLIRGTGISGLAGIPPVRGKVIRPLIEIDRKTIEDFVIERSRSLPIRLKEPYLIDSTNKKTDYLRNRLRLTVIPQLRSINPSLNKTVLRFAEIVRDEERYFDILVTKNLMRLISRKGEGFIELFWQPMEALDRAIIRRILRRAIDETVGLRGISFLNIEDIVELIKSGKTGSRVYIGKDIRVIKGYSTLLITSLTPQPVTEQLITAPGEIVIKEAKMVVIVTEGNLKDLTDYGNGKDSIVIDAKKAYFPFTVRSRRPGDFFYPSGFGKRKKLQDFFVDEKIPKDERDCIPIFTKDNDIFWITGYRMDERFKIDNHTEAVIKFQIKPLKT